MYGSSKHLSNLISQEIEESPNALSLVLNTLKIGIHSKSKEMVDWTIKLLSKMSFDFSSLNLNQKAYEWFTQEDSLLNVILNAIDKDYSQFEKATQLIMSFSKGNLSQLFSQHFLEYYSDEEKYWDVLISFLPLVFANEGFKEEVSEFILEK